MTSDSTDTITKWSGMSGCMLGLQAGKYENKRDIYTFIFISKKNLSSGIYT